jgi:hypothetical protein
MLHTPKEQWICYVEDVLTCSHDLFFFSTNRTVPQLYQYIGGIQAIRSIAYSHYLDCVRRNLRTTKCGWLLVSRTLICFAAEMRVSYLVDLEKEDSV